MSLGNQAELHPAKERKAGCCCGASSVGVMLLICLHLQFVLYSSQQSGAAEVQADPLRSESSSLQCRTDAGSWEWWLCCLSSRPCLSMGSWLSSLEASPTPHSHCGPRRAAVSCNQRWASALPAASASCTAVQPRLPNHLCCRGGKFWQRARQKAGGSSYAGPCWWGYNFSKAVKTLIQEFYSSVSSLVQVVHSNAIALQPYNPAVFSKKTDWGYLKKNILEINFFWSQLTEHLQI